MYCYFQCPETFKNDYDLRLHIKLRHRNEDPEELERECQAAEEEIAFTKRSGSRLKCAMCGESSTTIMRCMSMSRNSITLLGWSTKKNMADVKLNLLHLNAKSVAASSNTPEVLLTVISNKFMDFIGQNI